MAVFKVGDTVLLRRRRQGRDAAEQPLQPRQIAKIGRRWISLEGRFTERFAIRDEDGDLLHEPYNLDGEGYESAGHVFLSEESADSHRRAVAAWERMRKLASAWHPPRHVSGADLEAMVAKLEEPACSDS
jgi:hypothetical protein